ncbi:MAG: tetratricopeptide repeat protein [Myxococcaceae bacterium]
MAVADTKRDWKKRESFKSALVQIVVVALVLAGAVYFYIQRGQKKKDIADLLKETRAIALRDNPKDLEKALATLDKVFVLDARQPDALAISADIQTERWLIHRIPGADAKARELLKQCEDEGSRVEERFGARATVLVADGKATEATAFIDDLRKRGASSARLWYGLARAQQAQGTLALAKTGFLQAIDKAWKDPRFSTGYGEALLEEGQFLQGIDMFSKATASNPDHFQSRLGRSLAAMYRKDRVKEASDTLAEILGREAELSPGLLARALTVKSELATFEGRPDDGLAAANEALSKNPEEYFALFAKARALAAKKDPAATEAFNGAIAKRKIAPFFYFDAAQQLQAMGASDPALAVLAGYEATFRDVKMTTADGKSLAALDRDDRFWLIKGDILKETGKLDEAMAAYDKAVAAESVNLIKAHYAKGTVFYAKQDYDKAIETLTPITPGDGTGSLADAYVTMGDTLFAKKVYDIGCQNYAFALAKMKMQQAPREKLNALLEDVNKRLIEAKQKPMAKMWMEEAKPLIQ